MAEKNFAALRTNDALVIAAFKKIVAETGEQNANVSMQLFNSGTQISIPLSQVDKDTNAGEILKHKDSLCLYLTLSDLNGRWSIRLTRDGMTDKVSLSVSENHLDIQRQVKLANATSKNFKPYERTIGLEKILGDELSEFYGKREQALLKLEDINQEMIVAHKRQIAESDARLAEHMQRYDNEYNERREKLETNYHEREQNLDEKEKELNTKLKELDDRESKHVRRAIRNDLKKQLEQYALGFALSKATRNKRIVIHVIFIALIMAFGITLLGSLRAGFENETGVLHWVNIFRAIFAASGLIAMVLYYLKWNDLWFRQHAEEEFRLKRFGLDFDRASWIVEMALEWKREGQQEIPPQILESFSRNLFVGSKDLDSAQHPLESGLSAILGASSKASLKFGNFQAELDRKGAKRIGAQLAEEAE